MSALLQAFLGVLMHSFLPFLSFCLLLLIHRLIIHLAFEMFAVIQITDVIVQQFYEVAIILVFWQIGGDVLSEVSLNRNYSFLGLFIRQRMVHLAVI